MPRRSEIVQPKAGRRGAMEETSMYIGARQLYVESRIPEVRKHQPSILFIHGAYTGSWSWQHHLSYFSKQGWECDALNLRGHYRSGATDLSEVHFADYVEDVQEVIKHLGKEHVIITTSSGGIITQKYIEGNPARAAVLINSIPPKGLELPWVDSASLAAMPPTIELERESLRAEFPDISSEDFDRCFPLFGKEAGAAAKEWRTGIEIDVSKVSCPVLVVGSDLDERIPPGVSEKIAKFYHGDYLCCEGASHLGVLLGSNWERVARAVCQWLEEQGL